MVMWNDLEDLDFLLTEENREVLYPKINRGSLLSEGTYSNLSII